MQNQTFSFDEAEKTWLRAIYKIFPAGSWHMLIPKGLITKEEWMALCKRWDYDQKLRKQTPLEQLAADFGGELLDID